MRWVEERRSSSIKQKFMVQYILKFLETDLDILGFFSLLIVFDSGQCHSFSQMEQWRSFCWLFVTLQLMTRTGGMERHSFFLVGVFDPPCLFPHLAHLVNTRKNLTTCSKSANKLSTSCLRAACYKL